MEAIKPIRAVEANSETQRTVEIGVCQNLRWTSVERLAERGRNRTFGPRARHAAPSEGERKLGAILAIQEAVKAFDGSGGSVINISTIASANPSPNTLLYSASKSAIDTITRELALELASKGIRVNAIAPGMTETEGFAAAGLSAESAKALGFSLPMGGSASPRISPG